MASPLIISCIVVASSYPGYLLSPSLYTCTKLSEFDAYQTWFIFCQHIDTEFHFNEISFPLRYMPFPTHHDRSSPPCENPVEPGSLSRHLFFFTLNIFTWPTNISITAAERINLLETRAYCSICIRRQLSFEFRRIRIVHTVVQDLAISLW